MSSPKSFNWSRIFIIVIIYYLIVSAIVNFGSELIVSLGFPPWFSNWLQTSAWIVFPAIIAVVFILANRAKFQSDNILKEPTPHYDPETRIKENVGTSSVNPAIKTLAILPLTNKTANKDFDYFTDGLAEDLINALSKIEGLQVVARNSTMGLRKVQDIHEIVQKISLKYVLEGEVTRENDRFDITMRLVLAAAANTVLWSESFEGELKDLTSVLQKISENILNALGLKGIDTKSLFAKTGNSFEVYDLFLKGRYNFNQREKGLMKGIDLFGEALRIDPEYGPAHAGLANCYNLIGFYEFDNPNKIFPKAKKAALRALECDDCLAEAQTSLAFTCMLYDWNWKEANAHFLRALELNPGYVTANHWYAEFLMAMGKLDEAIKQSRHAQKYDPLNLIVSTLIGMAFYFSRKYDESIEEGRKTLNMAPDYLPVYIWMGLSYEQKGEFGKAVEILERGKNLTKGKHPKINAMLAHAHARSGKIDQAEDQLNELILKSKHGYVSNFNLARIYLGLNKKDLALQSLSKAYEDRDTWLVWLNVDPSFDEIRDDPVFVEIISKMNFDY